MRNRRLFPVVLAVGGFVAVAVGVYQGVIHVAPGYEGTIRSGWGGPLNHEEILLAQLSAVGIGGAVGALRWRRLAAVPIAAGGVVLFYAVRALLHQVQTRSLYTERATRSGEPIMFVLGAEPFLLIAGGVLLVAAGVGGWRHRANRSDGSEHSTAPSSTA